MKTFILKRIDWIGIVVTISTIFLLSLILSGCESKSGHMVRTQTINNRSGNIMTMKTLTVSGQVNDHTVILYDQQNQKQYLFIVENAYSPAYERGQKIWIINDN